MIDVAVSGDLVLCSVHDGRSRLNVASLAVVIAGCRSLDGVVFVVKNTGFAGWVVERERVMLLRQVNA